MPYFLGYGTKNMSDKKEKEHGSAACQILITNWMALKALKRDGAREV